MPRRMAHALVRTAALGLLVAASGPRARGQDGVPDARLGVRVAPLLLLSRTDVRDELKLTAEQTADSERTITDLHRRARALKGRHDAEAVEARDRIERASRAWIERGLTSGQRVRLIQLDLQWEGPSAMLSRPVVAESLALTQPQREAIARAVAERNARRDGGPPVEADEAELARVALGQLAETQRRDWLALLGPPHDFRAAAAVADRPRVRR